MLSNLELLTTQFYEWEQLGRGWLVFDYPVDLEPPFHPFFYHATPPVPFIDDGKRLTLLGQAINFFQNKKAPVQALEEDEFTIKPFKHDDTEPLIATSISIPQGYKVRVDEIEHLLLMLSFCGSPVSFEIIGTGTSIQLQFVSRQSDTLLLSGQLKAYFPGCVFSIHLADEIIRGDLEGTLIDFGLAEEFMRPLSMAKSFDLDPFTGLFGILEQLRGEERGAVQILFKGAVNPWTESIVRSVMDDQGGAFFLDAPEMLPLTKEKISCPLFGVTIRVLGQSFNADQAKNIAVDLGNALTRFSSSNANRLVPLTIEGYDVSDFVGDFIERKSHRLGMLLNSRELATFVHLPSPSIVSSKLVREIKKTKAAPESTEGHPFILGFNLHHGEDRVVSSSASQRLKHTHVIGATGTGKSTFLLNLITQDIQQGNGVGVLDPHGDLIENILERIPQNRINDVIIIDPADAEFPVGFNILKAHSDIEKEILSSDLVAAFKRLSTSWGDQMNSVFANAILAFLESSEGGTLMDLRRFLIEKPFRDSFLKTVTDPNVSYYWQKEFPILKSTSIGPILTRLDTFLRPKLIRNMVAQKESPDFEAILDSKKILLVKLSQGLIGNENSYLLGTFLVSKLQQAAMARQAKSKEARSDFFLYIDEFQNFITPSMSSILSGARKYHLGLILAHQDMQQLVKYDSELASSVISNAGTRICFRLGDTDAKKFAEGFSYFDAKDLQNLETGEAIARIDRQDFDFNMSSLSFNTEEVTTATPEQVISLSREKYGTPKSVVEEILQSMMQVPDSISEKMPVTKREPIFLQTPIEPQIEVPKVNTVLEVQPLTEVQNAEVKRSFTEKKELTEHRYLQTYIKRMAESRGYKASIEEQTPNKKGRVDVSLERNGKKIAIEICVTTTEEWELQNIEKCIAAGYDLVVECSTDMKVIEKMKKQVAVKLNPTTQAKVLVTDPNSFFQYLDTEIAKDASTETRMKGYRVKVEYGAVPQEDMNRKKESISKAVLESLQRKK
ncbi:MAG: type IV secretion system DNA-binding domain-containing protein [Bacteroidota bacterium]